MGGAGCPWLGRGYISLLLFCPQAFCFQQSHRLGAPAVPTHLHTVHTLETIPLPLAGRQG